MSFPFKDHSPESEIGALRLLRSVNSTCVVRIMLPISPLKSGLNPCSSGFRSTSTVAMVNVFCLVRHQVEKVVSMDHL